MAFLRFMGDESKARSYGYSLEVGGNGRKLVWEGTPRGIRDSQGKVRDSHDGLIIQRNMALHQKMIHSQGETTGNPKVDNNGGEAIDAVGDGETTTSWWRGSSSSLEKNKMKVRRKLREP